MLSNETTLRPPSLRTSVQNTAVNNTRAPTPTDGGCGGAATPTVARSRRNSLRDERVVNFGKLSVTREQAVTEKDQASLFDRAALRLLERNASAVDRELLAA